MLLGIELEGKNKSELDNGGRILILSPTGFIGKSNKKITPFVEEVTETKTISVADKYTLKAESLTTKDENNKTIVTEYWKKLSKMTDSVSTIIISNLSPFTCSEVLPKNELKLKFKSTINLFLQYISLHKKNIIIV